ncbi:MAG TPA: hypothetical protein VIM81_05805 [Gammaproteobacteria bacterium]
MTITDLGTIANLLAAIGVLVTLIYLSRQVRQGNLLAKSQARQRMVEQTHEKLYQWKNDPALRSCFVKKTTLSQDEQETVHYFLLAAMRQREWEWFQYKDGVIGKDVYEAYHEVISLHLGIPRTRRWWQTVGRIGFNPGFVTEVDSFLARRQLTNYFDDIRGFDEL